MQYACPPCAGAYPACSPEQDGERGSVTTRPLAAVPAQVLPPAAAQVQPLVECFFVLADVQVSYAAPASCAGVYNIGGCWSCAWWQIRCELQIHCQARRDQHLVYCSPQTKLKPPAEGDKVRPSSSGGRATSLSMDVQVSEPNKLCFWVKYLDAFCRLSMDVQMGTVAL